MDVHPETLRAETPQERVDRNLTDLLAELRVALPGVQVLLAFLLVVPFSARFEKVTEFEKDVYFATLLSAGIASVCLIAPSVHHRVVFRRQEKEHIVVTGNKLALVGLFFLALAITGVLVLVTDFLFGTLATVLVAGGFALLFAVVWYAIPLLRRMQG